MHTWKPDRDELPTHCWRFVNTFLAFVAIIGLIIVWATFYEHATFDQTRIVRNQHWDITWTMTNRTFYLPSHIKFDALHFAMVCCKSPTELKCAPLTLRKINHRVQLTLHRPWFGMVCKLHFPN